MFCSLAILRDYRRNAIFNRQYISITKILCAAEIEKRLQEVLGVLDVELDARFSEIRTHETNAGDFVCDAALAAVKADAVLINAGTLRADCVFAKGAFRQRDLERLLPFQTDLVVIGIQVWRPGSALPGSLFLPSSSSQLLV